MLVSLVTFLYVERILWPAEEYLTVICVIAVLLPPKLYFSQKHYATAA